MLACQGGWDWKTSGTLFSRAYLESFKTITFFSFMVAVLGIGLSLVLAVFADHHQGRAEKRKTLLKSCRTPWHLPWPACCNGSS
jgi:ABC-type sugar transport system permease subunit